MLVIIFVKPKAIIAAFARNKLTADFPANLDTLQLPLDYSYMGKRENYH